MPHFKPNDERLEDQQFWQGSEGDQRNWFAFTCRAPHFPGHVILAYHDEGWSQRYMEIKDKKENNENDWKREDVEKISKCPPGFGMALEAVVDIIFKWACEHKTSLPYIVFSRMNIAKEQFRVHIYPLSPAEIEEASRDLSRAMGKDLEGGFGYLAGLREREAEELDAKYQESDSKAMKLLLEEKGVAKVTAQLLAIQKKRK